MLLFLIGFSSLNAPSNVYQYHMLSMWNLADLWDTSQPVTDSLNGSVSNAPLRSLHGPFEDGYITELVRHQQDQVVAYVLFWHRTCLMCILVAIVLFNHITIEASKQLGMISLKVALSVSFYYEFILKLILSGIPFYQDLCFHLFP